MARRAGPEKPLPSIRTLAATVGASVYTTWKVVDRLRAEKLLAPRRAQSRKPTTGQPLWRCVADRVEHDVTQGAFAKGTPLPSLKELQARYDVSYPTIRKALELVRSRGSIEKGMGGYFVPRPVVSGRHFRVILLRYSADGRTPVWGAHDEEFIRLLEMRCANARLRIEQLGYVVEDDRVRFISLQTGKPRMIGNTETLLGIMIIVVNQASAHRSVFSALATTGRPVSILDAIGGWYGSMNMPRNLHHRLISLVGKAPGRNMGRYLLEQGHRDIAFFSPLYAEQWARDRFSELKEIFHDEARGRMVHLFAIHDHVRIWSYLPAAARRVRVENLVRSCNRWLQRAPREFSFVMAPLLHTAAGEQCAKGEIYLQLIPLFEKALRRSTLSAWVFDGDMFALMALDFLRKRGVGVPGKIALLSFQDSREALQARVTACSFNLTAAAEAMLDFSLHPTAYRWKRRGRVLDIDGTVIRRDTG